MNIKRLSTSEVVLEILTNQSSSIAATTRPTHERYVSNTF